MFCTDKNKNFVLFGSAPRGTAPKALAMVCLISLLMPVCVTGQQQEISAPQLREQIRLLEATDKDPSTTSEARALNKTFLKERRQSLEGLLTKEIAGLQKYHETMSQHLTAQERKKIDDTLRGLQEELGALKQGAVTSLVADAGPMETSSSKRSSGPNTSSSLNTSTSTNGPTNNVTTRPEPLNSESVSLQSTCYPDAPGPLVASLKAAAQLFLRGDDPLSQFGEASFMALSHAVAVEAGREDLFQDIERKQLKEQTKRTDKQIGSSARAEGSTSAAEKPGFAEILGFAVENGAVQQSISGTTLNLSTTPYALLAAVNGDTAANYRAFGDLSRIGISANFLIENQEDVLASARRRQLTGWSIRARITPDRSTRSEDAAKIWESISREFARPNLVITQMLRDTFGTDPVLEAKRRETADRFAGIVAQPSVVSIRDDSTLTAPEKISRIAEKFLCQIKTDIVDQVESGNFKLEEVTKKRIVDVTLPSYAQALQAKSDALAEFDRKIESLSLKPLLTFAYDNVRPVNQNNYSVLSMLFEKKSGGPFSLVANAGLSLYQRPDSVLRQQRVRDYAVALSIEGRAGRSPFLVEQDDESQITYSFTGRYQRMLENRFIPGRKADIAVAHFKLNIPFFAATSFPFSITYANATELIKEDHVRANFGFSFDADKLLKVIQLSRLPKR